MKKIIYALICVLLAGSFTLVAVKAATQTKRNQKLQDIQIQSKDIEATKLEVDLRRLNIELKKTLEDKNINESKVKDLEKQIDDAQKREERLQEQLQAKAKAKADAKEKAALAQRKALGTSKAYAASSGCTNAKSCIYHKESGGRTNAINKSSGACGLGQAWPCSKMKCSLTDYACQDKFFTAYAVNRYGSWEKAWSFWQRNHWW